MSDWQQIAALTLVGLAVAYLLRSLWGRNAGQHVGPCGGCRKCDDVGNRSAGAELPMVVQLHSHRDEREWHKD